MNNEKENFQIKKLMIILFIFVLIICGCIISAKIRSDRRQIWEGQTTIAHACGGIDGRAYTNSLEAFEYNYEAGHRTFEVDFCITSDDQMVCWHDWEFAVEEGVSQGGAPTQEEFLASKIEGVYTPMSLEMLLDLMQEYDDVWIVTDTKDTDPDLIKKEFEILLATAEKKHVKKLLDRFVIQIYHEEMYDVVEDVYHFPNYILTLYQLWGDGNTDSYREYCIFCQEKGIQGITMWYEWPYKVPEVLEIAQEYGIKLYTHTINDPQIAQEQLQMGISGVYTDYLTPDDLNKEQ